MTKNTKNPGKKRRTGRPSKLVPSIAKAILDALEEGATLEAAASIAGVSRRVVYLWIAEGKSAEASTVLGDFAASVERARDKAESEALIRVRQGVNVAGLPDWRAAEVWLRMRYPEKYGAKAINDRKVRAEVQAIMSAVLSRLSMGAAREVLDALELEFRLRGLLEEAPTVVTAPNGAAPALPKASKS